MEATRTSEFAPRSNVPLVDREEPLAELTRALEAAAAGDGTLLLMRGDSGIGKTRLAEELARLAIEQGVTVLWGHGWDGGGAPAYWPWLQVVRDLARRRSAKELDDEIGPGAPWLARLVPELADRLERVEGLPGHLGIGASDDTRYQLFAALTGFLRAASRSVPLLVVLDDIHAADEPSLLALTYLAGELRGSRVLVLANVQSDARNVRPGVRALLTELAGAGGELALDGLEARHLSLLIRERTGIVPETSLVERVREATGGNPYFSDEVARLLLAEQRLAAAARPTAGTPEADLGSRAILQRLDDLPAETLHVLEVTAVIGLEARLRTLARATRKTTEQLARALEAARHARLIEPDPTAPERIRFAHGLVRDALLERVGPAERRELHRAAGRALEVVYQQDAEPHLAELAHHFLQAAPGGDAELALDYATRAGRRAMRLLAFEQAANLFEAAIAVHDLDSPPSSPDLRRATLLHQLGQARMRAGDARARETLAAAAGAARSCRAPELFAQAALDYAGFGLSAGVVDFVLVALLEEALRHVGTDDSPLRVRLLSRLAVALYWSPQSARRHQLVDEAVATARRLGEPTTLAFALNFGHLATAGPDTAERGLAWTKELAELAERTGTAATTLQAFAWQADLLLELDDLPGSEAATEELASRAEQTRDPRGRCRALLLESRKALLEGRWAAGAAGLAAGKELGERTRDQAAGVLIGAQAFQLRWMTGGLDELEPTVRTFAERLPGMPVWRCALVLLLALDGRAPDARAELDRLDVPALPRDNVLLVALSLLAEAAHVLGDATLADQVHDVLGPFGARNAVSPGGICLGPVARPLALVALVRADHEGALARIETARARARSLGAAPLLALTDLDEAEALIQRAYPGDLDRAAALLDRGADRAAALGVVFATARADRLRTALADAATATSAG